MVRLRFPLVLVGAIAASALVGCSSGGDFHGSDGSAGVPATVTPAGTPVSDVDYTALLTTVAADVVAAIDQLRLSTPETLETEVPVAEDRITAAKNKVTAVNPPPVLGEGHSQVIASLDDIARQLRYGLDDYRSGSICTPSAVADGWSNLPGADRLRGALALLGPVGAPLAAILPPAGPLDRRLETGTLVKDPGNGQGEIRIENGTDTDAAVTLAQNGQAVGTVYTARNTTTTMTGLPTGSYRIYVAWGADWDPVAAGFSRSCTFDEFVFDGTSEITYGMAPDYAGGYDIWLQTFPDGTATFESVDRDQFPV